MDSSLRFTDVLYFLGELAVYVSVAWWGFTRDVPVVMRLLLGVGGIAVFVTRCGGSRHRTASMPRVARRGALNLDVQHWTCQWCRSRRSRDTPHGRTPRARARSTGSSLVQ